MIEVGVRFDASSLRNVRGSVEGRAARVALDATDRGATRLKNRLRDKMRGAGLGRLGFALGATSDKKKTGQVFRRGYDSFSASGTVFIRSKSRRTVGAIISYTEGAKILPRRGKYLWFPTDDIRRRARVPLPSSGGNARTNIRLEPRFWKQAGLDKKIGELVPLTSKSGRRLLVVRDVAVSAAGKKGSARRRLKSGRAPKGFQNRDLIVAFIGIPNTSRQARIDARAEARAEVQTLRNEIGALT